MSAPALIQSSQIIYAKVNNKYVAHMTTQALKIIFLLPSKEDNIVSKMRQNRTKHFFAFF